MFQLNEVKGMWWLWTTVSAASTIIIFKDSTGKWNEHTRQYVLKDLVSIMAEIPSDNILYTDLMFIKGLLEMNEISDESAHRVGSIMSLLTNSLETSLAGELHD